MCFGWAEGFHLDHARDVGRAGLRMNIEAAVPNSLLEVAAEGGQTEFRRAGAGTMDGRGKGIVDGRIGQTFDWPVETVGAGVCNPNVEEAVVGGFQVLLEVGIARGHWAQHADFGRPLRGWVSCGG